MGIDKLQKFYMEVVKRSSIQEAEYNPRKISEESRKKLKKGMKKLGLLTPIIVNKTTGNVVAGHQRLNIMDEENKYPDVDYDLTVAMVKLSEEDEVKANVLLNNQAVMGEWDMTMLGSLKEMFPSIDYETDFGFDGSDLDIMFGPREKKTKSKAEIEHKAEEYSAEDFRAMKKEQREKAKESNEEQGGGYHLNDNDYAVTFIFPNNREKIKFMERCKKPAGETHLKSTVLFDIASGVYNIKDV
jgi:hypothetical protein